MAYTTTDLYEGNFTMQDAYNEAVEDMVYELEKIGVPKNKQVSYAKYILDNGAYDYLDDLRRAYK